MVTFSIAGKMDNSIIESCKKLCELLSTEEIYGLGRITLECEEEKGTIIIPLRRQVLIEEFTEKLITCLDLQVLFAYCTNNGRDYRVIIYSIPREEQLYIISMESTQYGILEDITVTFYISLDTMYEQLYKSLAQLKHIDGEVLEQQTPEVLFRNFI